MTKTEDQLRDALTGIAELVQTSEKAAAPRPAGGRTRRMVAWIAPAAVAAAVLLVIVVGVVAASLRPSPEREAPVAAGVSGRYFVAGHRGAGTGGNGVTVRDVTTGRVTAQVELPKGATEWGPVGATADNTTFYLGSSTPTGAAKAHSLRPIKDLKELKDLAGKPAAEPFKFRLHRLRIDAAGRVVDLTPVAKATDLPYLRGLAISPDGKRAAFPVQIIGQRDSMWSSEIDILNLETGRRDVYKTSQFSGGGDLSWSGDGRWLAFEAGYSKGGKDAGIRVLDTSAGAGGDLAGARKIIDWEHGPLGTMTTPVLSADGTRLYVIAAQKSLTGGPTWTRVIEVEVATGRQLRTLFEQRYGANQNNSVWMFTSLVRDASGQNLLIISNGYGYRLDIGTARATRIPFPEGDPTDLVW